MKIDFLGSFIIGFIGIFVFLEGLGMLAKHNYFGFLIIVLGLIMSGAPHLFLDLKKNKKNNLFCYLGFHKWCIFGSKKEIRCIRCYKIK